MRISRVETTREFELLDRLLQTYEAEFSAITKKVPGEDGRYSLDVDLREADNYILCVNDVPAGFCVKGFSEGRHDIFEFYVSPESRRRKLGREFAKSIFARYSGEWQVRQIEGADLAVQFWRTAISEFTNGSYHEEIVEDPYWGKVTRQTFLSP